MRLLLLLTSLILWSQYSTAEGKRCGPYSCLHSTPSNGGHNLQIQAKEAGGLYCFIKWENFKYIEKLEIGEQSSKTFYLKPHYSPAGVKWRCSPQEPCLYWMKNAGLCER